jgi:hypothetical protein
VGRSHGNDRKKRQHSGANNQRAILLHEPPH